MLNATRTMQTLLSRMRILNRRNSEWLSTGGCVDDSHSLGANHMAPVATDLPLPFSIILTLKINKYICICTTSATMSDRWHCSNQSGRTSSGPCTDAETSYAGSKSKADRVLLLRTFELQASRIMYVLVFLDVGNDDVHASTQVVQMMLWS